MKGIQEKLLPYVEARIEEIISYKDVSQIRPLIATEPEILYSIRDDVIECMRELHKRGKYRGTNTLNYPAIQKI